VEQVKYGEHVIGRIKCLPGFEFAFFMVILPEVCYRSGFSAVESKQKRRRIASPLLLLEGLRRLFRD
jgi:hypothetical protein